MSSKNKIIHVRSGPSDPSLTKERQLIDGEPFTLEFKTPRELIPQKSEYLSGRILHNQDQHISLITLDHRYSDQVKENKPRHIRDVGSLSFGLDEAEVMVHILNQLIQSMKANSNFT
jgi:hypothetical protein